MAEEKKQSRETEYPQHRQHLARRATSVPSKTRYTRKRKHRSRED